MIKTDDTHAARRDEQLRRSLIDCTRRLANRAADGWVSGQKLTIAARDDEARGVDDVAHGERLLADLVDDVELLVEQARPPVGGIGKPDLRHRHFKLSEKGWRFFLGQIGPIPGIAGGDE